MQDQGNPATEQMETSQMVDTPDGCVYFPLSFGQQRLWFLDQLDPGNSAYNSAGGLRFRGVLNVEALQRALDEIVARHEVLRTTFRTVNGTPMQVVHRPTPLELRRVDLSGIGARDRENELKKLATESAEQSFDLATGPLLRGTLVRLAEEEHALLLTVHHIINDGWSVGVFSRELAVLYESFVAGKPSPLPELPIQYGDFSEWQREYLKGEVLENHLKYWTQQLGGAPPLDLPTDRPRPSTQTFRGAELVFRFDRDLSTQVKQFSTAEGVTPFITLLAAFNVLVARYTNQEDISVGTPIANRTHVETEQLIGFFVNTLVMRSDLTGDPSFRTLVQRVRNVAIQAYAHQDLPFEKIVEHLQPKRDMSRSALFQVMLVLQNAPVTEMQLPGLTLSPLEFEREVAKFDLTFTMAEEENGFGGVIEYNCDLFERSTIERMAEHWQTLVRSATNDPHQRVWDLDAIPPAERSLIDSWNQTAAPYPREKTITTLFEEQVSKTPRRVALRDEKYQVTFEELDRRANRIAHWLRKNGAAPRSVIGVSLERSIDTVAVLLGIIKAGAAYLPLDPDYPAQRLQFMLEDSGIEILVTRDCHRSLFQRHGLRVLCLDSDAKGIAAESADGPNAAISPEDPFYVLYTSGSTGRPKAVMAPHVGTVNRFFWMWNNFPFGEGEVCCQKTSLNFVDSVWEIFGPLLQGVPSYIISNRVVQDPRQLADTLARNKVSRIVLVPSLLRLLTDVYARAGKRHDAPKYWIASGEALTTDLAAQLLRVLPDSKLINLYGCSEVAADATYYVVPEIDGGGAGVPIGRPISNVQIHILDRHSKHVPIGIPGEIYVGGDAPAIGYRNQPKLTSEKFLPDPFRSDAGARLYRTGDLGRYRVDGAIEYLGRIDHQVKIRGQRVELGEIEAVLREYEGVHDCVAVARGQTASEKRIVAYVASTSGVVTAESLRTFLQTRLPEVMIPAAFVIMQALPLTPNGKVDRLSLPEPEKQSAGSSHEYVAPRDALEVQVTRVWEKVLRTRPIGVNDNFFELGGHSFLAVDLFSELEKSFGKVLPLATLFQAPTVAQLADVIRHEGWEDAWASLVPLQPQGAAPPFFCVHSLGTNLVSYGHLARNVGTDQPFYGLQPVGLDGREEPHSRVEDMATHYLSQIRKLQPEGPYHLGGVCLGGVVAYEMAQQLRRNGEQVGLLVLIDSQVPGFPKHLPKHPLKPSLIALADWYLGDVLMRPFGGKVTYIATRIKNIGLRISRTGKGIARHVVRSIGEPAVVAATIQKVKRANAIAGGSYRPEPYDGKVTLFWCSEVPARSYQDRRLGWSDVAQGGLEVHVIPGNHMTMVDHPHVVVMAEKLRNCLQKTHIGSRSADRQQAVAANSR